MDVNQIINQITGSMGPFILYGGLLVVALLIATYFINTFRGIVITAFILASGYYVFLASPDERKSMDLYAKNVYQSIIGKNIDKASKAMESKIKKAYSQGAEGVKELYKKSGEQ